MRTKSCSCWPGNARARGSPEWQDGRSSGRLLGASGREIDRPGTHETASSIGTSAGYARAHLRRVFGRASKMPDKLRDMQKLFTEEATKYNVFPLDNSVVQRLLAPHPGPS